MASHRIAPENPEERLIFWALAGAWGFYVIGAVYVVGPVLVMSLLGIHAWRWYCSEWRPADASIPPVPVGVVVWGLGTVSYTHLTLPTIYAV